MIKFVPGIQSAHCMPPPLIAGHPGSGSLKAVDISALLRIVLQTSIHKKAPIEPRKMTMLNIAT